MCRNVHNLGAKPGAFEPKNRSLRTAIDLFPVRVYLNLGCGGWRGKIKKGDLKSRPWEVKK